MSLNRAENSTCAIKGKRDNNKARKWGHTFMQRKTWFCLWSSTRTATRSDLSKRETWEEMKRSRRMKLDWSLLSSLTTIRPSLPISFFLLHIERLGLEAEPAMKRNSNCCCNRSRLRNVEREKRWKGVEETGLLEILRRRFGARRSIKIVKEPWSNRGPEFFSLCTACESGRGLCSLWEWMLFGEV